MSFCLTIQEKNKFKESLRNREIDPAKLSNMTSLERRAFLEKYVGKENAKTVNALFESKLLLKNQKAGFITWAKKVSGISVKTKMDLLSKIERMDKVLDPAEGEQFLQDLASARLRLDITQEEAKTIADLSKKVVDSRSKADSNGIFSSEIDRITYGTNQYILEEYINGLKLEAKNLSFRENPVKKTITSIGEIPGVLKSMVSTLDNSFFGRQGIKVLYTKPMIWGKAFLKSWVDMGRTLKGKDAMAVIKADIYSRPNALNGKYKAGNYGLDVLSEEAYPSSLPERIPLLGRIFKAAETAYNGAALRMRADLADKYIAIAEKQGINTLNKTEAEGIGNLVTSLTGRGNLGKADVLSKEANVLFFSVKFLKSNFDTLVAHSILSGKATKFTKKEAAKNLLRLVAVIGTILTTAKIIDKDSVQEDPRGTNFGKIKIFGKWTDITGGMSSLVTLASRIVPTVHDGQWGFWSMNANGKWTNLTEGKYGQQNAMDVVDNFWQGKLAPLSGVVRDIWKGQTYGGLPITIWGELRNITFPMSTTNLMELMNDPNAKSVVGSMILDGLGFSVSTYPESNLKSGFIPENEIYKNEDFISGVIVYAKALGIDPETAFNRIFTGQKITRVTNGTVIVERMPLADSQDVKKKAGANNPQMKLDHTIPLELGGSNDKSNLKIVTTSEWSSYTSVENALGKALKEGKISKNDAQQLILDFKNKKITKEQVLAKIK